MSPFATPALIASHASPSRSGCLARERALEQAVRRQLDHRRKADAVRTDHRDGAVRVAHRRHAVALAVVALELTAVAAERGEHARPVRDLQRRPVVAVEVMGAAAPQTLGVGMAQVERPRLAVLHVLPGLVAAAGRRARRSATTGCCRSPGRSTTGRAGRSARTPSSPPAGPPAGCTRGRRPAPSADAAIRPASSSAS